MNRATSGVLLVLVGLAAQDPVDAQVHCALGQLFGSCSSCDGLSITGQAAYGLIGECYSCVTRCPDDRSSERSEIGSTGASSGQVPSCGLTWSQFAEQAALAEKASDRADARYVRVDLDRDFLELLAARAPLMVNYFIVRDGHIRLDISDPSLSSVKEEPAMISSFIASSEMADWLIDRRATILTESGRKNVQPPPRQRLPADERQVLYSNVERVGEDRMIATIRATRFEVAEGGAGPSVFEEQVLVLELTAGPRERIPDRVRPILGENRPGSRLNARIEDYALSRHASSRPRR